MRVCIDLADVNRINSNIGAIERAVHGHPKLSCDDILLVDVLHILDAIKKEYENVSTRDA